MTVPTYSPILTWVLEATYTWDPVAPVLLLNVVELGRDTDNKAARKKVIKDAQV